MRHTIGRSAAIAAAVVMALAAGAASAQEQDQGLTYALRAGAGYSDNLGRQDGDEIDSMFYSLGGTLNYVRDEGRVNSKVALDLDWVDYEAEGFDSQVYGDINAILRYALIPERLSWLFQNNFGQGSRNPFTSRSPENVENINYFTTGPDLTVRFGNASGVVLDARYSNVWYEDSPNNSDRFGGGANLFHELSPASRTKTYSSTTAPRRRTSTRPTCWAAMPSRARAPTCWPRPGTASSRRTSATRAARPTACCWDAS